MRARACESLCVQDVSVSRVALTATGRSGTSRELQGHLLNHKELDSQFSRGQTSGFLITQSLVLSWSPGS